MELHVQIHNKSIVIIVCVGGGGGAKGDACSCGGGCVCVLQCVYIMIDIMWDLYNYYHFLLLTSSYNQYVLLNTSRYITFTVTVDMVYITAAHE